MVPAARMHMLVAAIATWAGATAAPEAPPPGAGVLVGVSPGSRRGLPLLGFGNEAALQNVADEGLAAAAAAAAGSRVLRYPGGAPSNTWDWAKGCCENMTDPALRCVRAAWNDQGGFGTATPAQWARYARSSGSPLTVFDLNVVTSNASHQVEGLQQIAAAGVAVTHLEFGNELYDGQQNLGRWSDGAGYVRTHTSCVLCRPPRHPHAGRRAVLEGRIYRILLL